ncbi:AI-2E family transporter [Bacteroides sp. GD17]|jgi:predicted PurR-regulated permease PerM|uniref:AI-2E family transporter n=1 Tax=Bacteroides sp. GD17 TaxID=3139826 RepID=UPI0025E7518C|nr:AI-2E family transporter [uncultured Bacteroides sp.]
MSTKEQYWKYSLIAIIIGLGIILFRQITPFLGGLLGAITIYTLVRKQMIHLSDKRRMRRSVAATLITAEAILCFLVPLGLVVWLAVVNLQNINLDPQAIIAPFEEAANIIKAKTGYYILGKDTVAYVISTLPRIGQAIMAGISSFAVNVFVLIFVLYFMLIGGKKMEQYINDILPFNDVNTRNVVNEIDMIIRSNAVGIPLLAIIQGGVAMIGYWIFGAPNILFTGFLTCFASIIPMVGTALVWFPIAVYMALVGNWVQAIGLAVYGGVVISQLDNLIRFIIQKKMADIHPLITVFGVVIGLPLFGFMGVIFGPLLLSLFFLFVDMFKRGYLDVGKRQQ